MTEFPPPDFLRDHPWTPPCHSHFPSSQLLLLNSIFAPSWPQFSLIGLCSSPGPLPSSRVTSRLLGTPPRVPRVPFQWYLELYHKWCYDLKSLEWDNKTTLVLSNTRELDRVPKTK